MRALLRFAGAVVVLFFVSIAVAQKPEVSHAHWQEVSASAGLKATMDGLVQQQTAPLWIGYRIPAAARERSMCCFDWSQQAKSPGQCCGGCKMESDKGSSFNGTIAGCSPEPLPYAFIFYRAEGKQLGKLRVYSADCVLDFADLPVYWLEGVKPEQSVDLLTNMALSDNAADDDDERRHGNKPMQQALMAIAMHDTPAADIALEKLIQPNQRLSLREDVVFWLGVERGKKGVELLRKYAMEDPNDKVREKAAFAFSQSKEPEALKDLINMARHDQSPHVRGQAIFWMAQIGSKKEAAQITEAIENDPDTEVKKKAVFALSQMHDADAVPRLIAVAKTNKNPVVKKQAIFWLGQTNDPRALDFLEEILTK
jgi:hypothetical protein